MRRIIEMSEPEREAMGRNGRARVEAGYGEALVVDAALQAIESIMARQ